MSELVIRRPRPGSLWGPVNGRLSFVLYGYKHYTCLYVTLERLNLFWGHYLSNFVHFPDPCCPWCCLKAGVMILILIIPIQCYFLHLHSVCVCMCVWQRERKCNIACLLRYYVAVTTQKISHGVYCRVVNPVTIIDLVKWLIMALSLVLFLLNVDAFF